MADEKDNNIPAWQQQAEAKVDPTATDASKSDDDDDVNNTSEQVAEEATIEQARQFLNDENVRDHSIEKKTEFLKSKGFSAEQIQVLLGETEQTPEVQKAERELEPQPTSAPASASAPSPPQQQEAASPTVSPSSTTTTEPRADVPPIITYPEFLTTSPKPHPLITPSRLLNILAVSSSAWTLLYGGARYIINPMVNNLNDARSEYYQHVGEKLGEFVERLEGVVSEVPYKDKDGKVILLKSRGGEDNQRDEDAESTVSDPTELFHRDFGTQTTPPSSSSTPPSSLLESGTRSPTAATTENESIIDRQASRLKAIRAHVADLNDMYARRSAVTAELSASVRAIRDDVDNLALPPAGAFAYSTSDYLGGGGGGGSTRGPNGSDEEFRRTKDAIRSVKGMFLSTRSFPGVTAR